MLAPVLSGGSRDKGSREIAPLSPNERVQRLESTPSPCLAFGDSWMRTAHCIQAAVVWNGTPLVLVGTQGRVCLVMFSPGGDDIVFLCCFPREGKYFEKKLSPGIPSRGRRDFVEKKKLILGYNNDFTTF